MLFSQHRSNADEDMLIQLSFSTKYQLWNNIESSTLNWRNFFNVFSTLLCQRRNNVDECGQSALLQRWFNVNVFAGQVLKILNNHEMFWRSFRQHILDTQPIYSGILCHTLFPCLLLPSLSALFLFYSQYLKYFLPRVLLVKTA